MVAQFVGAQRCKPEGRGLEFFIDNSFGRTLVLGLTLPLTETSTRNIFWGKGGRCVGLTSLPLRMPIVLKSGSINLLELSGPV